MTTQGNLASRPTEIDRLTIWPTNSGSSPTVFDTNRFTIVFDSLLIVEKDIGENKYRYDDDDDEDDDGIDGDSDGIDGEKLPDNKELDKGDQLSWWSMEDKPY